MENGTKTSSENIPPSELKAMEKAGVDSTLSVSCETNVPPKAESKDEVSEPCDSKSLSDSNVPSSDSGGSEDRTLQSSVNDCSHLTIMSACSAVGEHIRRNITEVLNSRDSTEDVTSQLQAAMIEKLEIFESSVMGKLSDVSPKTSDGVLQLVEDDKSLLLPNELCDSEQKSMVQSASDESSRMSNEELQSSELKAIGQDNTDLLHPVEPESLNSTPNCVPVTNSVDSDKAAADSLQNDSLTVSMPPQSEAVCNLLEDHLTKATAKTLSSDLCQSIMNIIKSKVPSLANASSNDLFASLELAVGEQLENLRGTLLETVAEGPSCALDKEESSSLSGEADTTEKECGDDIASESSLTLQNGEQHNAKNLPTSHNAPLTDNKALKKSQRSGAHKKKGEKTIGFFTSQTLKSLSSYPTADEKLNVLCRKHAETLDKLKSTEIYQRQNERQVIQLSREKEQLQAEHNRNILAKSRLESLCRELQRQNRAVKEESLIRIREEEEKRKEVASKFQMTLNEISTLMQENSKKNLQLKEENAELAQKLKTLVEHYEMWEKHMEKVVQQKDLEAQLAKAKQAQINLQLKQETEAFLQEKKTLLENMNELQKKCTQLASNETVLRTELCDYISKYDEFQSVLNKSNKIFASFKTDMDTTSRKIKKLENETTTWQQKWESSNNALLNMIVEKQTKDKELHGAQQRISTLEKLCRALQAERNDLRSKVKERLTEENCNVPPEGENQAC